METTTTRPAARWLRTVAHLPWHVGVRLAAMAALVAWYQAVLPLPRSWGEGLAILLPGAALGPLAVGASRRLRRRRLAPRAMLVGAAVGAIALPAVAGTLVPLARTVATGGTLLLLIAATWLLVTLGLAEAVTRRSPRHRRGEARR